MSFLDTIEKDAAAAVGAVRELFKPDPNLPESVKGAALADTPPSLRPAPLPTPKAPDAGKAEVISL